MYGNVFDFFDLLAGSWTRSVKEKDGYIIKEAPNGKGYVLVFNTLGIAPEDIKVTHSPVSETKYSNYSGNSTYVRVCGSTQIKEISDKFSVNYEVVFNNRQPVDTVQYKVENGLTIVYIKTKEEEINGTPASQIENGGSFNW